MGSSVYMFQINMVLSLDYGQKRKLQIIYSFDALLAIRRYIFLFLKLKAIL